jgi:hypothetical protein
MLTSKRRRKTKTKKMMMPAVRNKEDFSKNDHSYHEWRFCDPNDDGK